MRLDNKVALITGGSGDVGRVIATAFAKEGAVVVINGRNQEKAERVAASIKENEGKSCAIGADVSEVKAVTRMFKKIKKNFGRLDILVNNAGVAIGSPLITFTDEDWDKVIRTNLYSVFYCCREALKLMLREKTGRIINISSMLAFIGEPAGTGYTASKGAINSFTKSLARDVGDFGITVNAICLGFVDTEMLQQYLKSGDHYAKFIKDVWDSTCPVSRDLLPEDVANLALFLASSESSFINGQLLKLDGGTI
ncbi:MAG: SDR family NAD(P)-dependent oxidoreductase [Promethearchaeota archaeon]|jgi:3-oxoacyl-[acyl-carrier protein] reductase